MAAAAATFTRVHIPSTAAATVVTGARGAAERRFHGGRGERREGRCRRPAGGKRERCAAVSTVDGGAKETVRSDEEVRARP